MYVMLVCIRTHTIHSNDEWPIESIPNATIRSLIPLILSSHFIRNTDTTFIHSGNGMMMWQRIASHSNVRIKEISLN